MKAFENIFVIILVITTAQIYKLLGEPANDTDFVLQKAYSIAYSLRKIEPDCEDIYSLRAKYDDAYRTFTKNSWPDPEGYIELSYKWYNFLVYLYEKFGKPNIQELRDNFEDTSLVQECRTHHEWTLTPDDIHKLEVFNVSVLNNPDFQYIREHTIDRVKTKFLCDIMTITFSKPRYNVTHPTTNSLRIHGDIVRTRDLPSLFMTTDPPEILEIFALEKFIMDDFLWVDSLRNLKLIIISPIWFALYRGDIPNEILDTFRIRASGNDSMCFGLGLQMHRINTHLSTLYTIPPVLPLQVGKYRLKHLFIFLKDNKASSQTIWATFELDKYNYDYHAMMNAYGRYLLQNWLNPVRNHLLSEFFQRTYTYANFPTSIFNTLGFAHELEIIEDYFVVLYRENVDMRAVYDTIGRRFQEYSLNPRTQERALEYIKVRKYIQAVLLSKDNVFTNDESLALNLENYLKDSISKSISLGDVVKKEASHKLLMYNQDIKNRMTNEIMRIKQYVTNEITSQMDLTNAQLDIEVDRLLQQIALLKKNVRRNIEIRKMDERALIVMQSLKFFYSILGAIGGILLSVGTAGTGAFLYLGGVMVTESVIASSLKDPEITQKLKLPGAIYNVQNFIDQKAQTLQDFLDFLDNKESQFLGSVKQYISVIRTELLKGVGNAPFENVEELLIAKERELKAIRPVPSKALGVVEKLKQRLRVAQASSADMYIKYYRNETALRILDEAARKKEPDEIKLINQYERNVHSLLVPTIKFLRNQSVALLNMTGTTSLASIDMKRWQANNLLEDIRFRVREFTEGWRNGKMMLHLIEKLQRALNLVYSLLSRIIAFHEYGNMIDSMTDANVLAYERFGFKNIEVMDAIDNLKYIARYNTAIGQYKKAMHTYRLYAFPFSTMLDGVDNFDLRTERSTLLTTKDIAYNAELQLSYLSLKMNKYKRDISETIGAHILEANFDDRPAYPSAFYVWNSKDYPGIIDNLFSGNAVELFADIKKGVLKNAVKFNRLGIRFLSENPNDQKVLDDALLPYDVQLTHSGQSYFRCGDALYKVSSTNFTIVYSYRKDSTGKPDMTSMSYKMLEKGDFLLSPYTKWTVRLETDIRDFAGLKSVKSKVKSILLEGHGQYIRGDVCSINLYKYYELIDS